MRVNFCNLWCVIVTRIICICLIIPDRSGFIILVFGILFYMRGIVTIIKYLLRYSLICLIDTPVRETRRRWRGLFMFGVDTFKCTANVIIITEIKRKINALELKMLLPYFNIVVSLTLRLYMNIFKFIISHIQYKMSFSLHVNLFKHFLFYSLKMS